MAEEMKKIRVLLRSQETVTYHQIREMTPEEWAELKSLPPKVACDWINRSDVCEGDDGELADNFEAIVVGDDNRPVKPKDEYK